MKKLCFNEKQKEYIGILGVVFFSLAVFMIISKGNLNFGLFSDNQTQWLPVIDKAYQTFFQTGRFVKFHNWKQKHSIGNAMGNMILSSQRIR